MHTTHSSKEAGNPKNEIKEGAMALGRGHPRVCLFLDYSDRAIRKSRLCFSCSVPPSREARKHIRPYLVLMVLWALAGPLPEAVHWELLQEGK
jgi:hypothetical protein